MSRIFVIFKWMDYPNSRDSEWVIKKEDYIDKKYKFFYNNRPLRSIHSPYIVGHNYITTVGYADGKYESDTADVNDIFEEETKRKALLNL